MLKLIQKFIRDEEGVTAIEYGLMAALVALAIITAASLLGTNLGGLFTKIAGCLSSPTAENANCSF